MIVPPLSGVCSVQFLDFFPSNSRHNSKSRYKPSQCHFSCLTAMLESNVIVQCTCNAKAKLPKHPYTATDILQIHICNLAKKSIKLQKPMPRVFTYKSQDAIRPGLKTERGDIFDHGNTIVELDLFWQCMTALCKSACRSYDKSTHYQNAQRLCMYETLKRTRKYKWNVTQESWKLSAKLPKPVSSEVHQLPWKKEVFIWEQLPSLLKVTVVPNSRHFKRMWFLRNAEQTLLTEK